MKEPVQLPQSEIQLQQRCAELERDNARLRDALQGVMGLIEKGDLVRDTKHDHESGWALRQIPFVATLAKATAALELK